MAALIPAIPPPTTSIPRSRPAAVCPFPLVPPMCYLRDLRGERHLLELPLPALRVTPGVDEDLPVGLVELGEVAPVVVAGPPGLLAEEHMPQAGLGRVDPVPHLPAPQEVVEVPGGQVGAVLPEELHELEAPLQGRAVG